MHTVAVQPSVDSRIEGAKVHLSRTSPHHFPELVMHRRTPLQRKVYIAILQMDWKFRCLIVALRPNTIVRGANFTLVA